MLATRAYIPDHHLPHGGQIPWPFDVPCVEQLAKEGMAFTAPITFLVGENGSGKSTLVEGFAEAWGLDARGGRAGRKYVNDRPKTPWARWSTSTPPQQVASTATGLVRAVRATSYAPRPPSGS